MDNSIFDKFISVLNSRKLFWYAGKEVTFIYKSHYVEFDEHLNREICFADYSSEEKIMSCNCIFMESTCELSISKQVVNLSGETFFQYLQKNNFCNFNVPLCTEGFFIIDNSKVEAKFELVNGSIENVSIKCDPFKIQIWLKTVMQQFLSFQQNLRVNLESRKNYLNETVTIDAFIPLSYVELELSTDSNNDTASWKEITIDSNCIDFIEFDKNEALLILKENGIVLPPNADNTGWYRNEYGGNTNAFIFRCEHRMPDTLQTNFNDTTESTYNQSVQHKHCGYITVENDIFQCMVDTKNRKVISCCQKWQNESILRESIMQAN